MHSLKKLLVVYAAVLVSACTSLPFYKDRIELGPDQVACVGTTPDAIAGFDMTNTDTLRAKALGVSGKGGVCAAKTFVATKPGVVYRVYDGEKGASSFGRWWAFGRPSGSREEYRAAYGICEEWSGLNRLVACEVKVGAEVVVGTTQSVSCATTSYPKTSNLQVYVPNDRASGYLAVENCVELGEWP